MNKPDRDSITTLARVSHVSYETAKSVMESLTVMVLLGYASNQPFHLPEIGDVVIRHLGDEMTPKGRVAKLDITVQPDPFMVRNVGQLADGEQGDILQRYKRKVQNLLRSRPEDKKYDPE